MLFLGSDYNRLGSLTPLRFLQNWRYWNETKGRVEWLCPPFQSQLNRTSTKRWTEPFHSLHIRQARQLQLT